VIIFNLFIVLVDELNGRLVGQGLNIGGEDGGWESDSWDGSYAAVEDWAS
jgi:hypothetical protein